MSIQRTVKKTIKLKTGQRIRSNDPVREFEKNVQARWTMLIEAGLQDELHLADLWGEDALNRRQGIRTDEDRAHALNLSVEQLVKFDARVKELDRTAWKKAADFYKGLLVSGILDQTVRVYGGIYHQHKVWSFREIGKNVGQVAQLCFAEYELDVV